MPDNPIFKSSKGLQSTGNVVSNITGRVEYVILTNNQHKYKGVDIPVGSLGHILFSIVGNTPDKITNTNYFLAHPKSNLKRYPIVNELVPIDTGASFEAQSPKGTLLSNYYYGDPLPVFNGVNHNSTPSYAKFSEDVNPMPTGTDFKERSGLIPLQPLPGCTIIEGRFGNSIRLGSSNDSVDAPWKGPKGDPVTIIRNGQKVQTEANITSVFEDINGDGTVLAMFSTQTVPFNPSCTNFKSYDQEVTIQQRNNYIKTDPVKQEAEPVATESATSADTKAVEKVVDTPSTNYEVKEQPTQTITAEQELNELPDSEDELTKIFEDEGPRHVEGSNDRWIYAVTNTSIENVNTDNIDLNSPYLKTYLIHQQGMAGLKAIYKAAASGQDRVPSPNNINWHMYGKRLTPSYKYSNVGDDFEKRFGRAYTPLNFLKYWAAKLEVKIKSSAASTQYDYIFRPICDRLRVDINLARAVCSIESSFNPKTSTGDYKGLFQLNDKEFKTYYPSGDIFNPQQNADVGIRLLKDHLSSIQTITAKL